MSPESRRSCRLSLSGEAEIRRWRDAGLQVPWPPGTEAPPSAPSDNQAEMPVAPGLPLHTNTWESPARASSGPSASEQWSAPGLAAPAATFSFSKTGDGSRNPGDDELQSASQEVSPLETAWPPLAGSLGLTGRRGWWFNHRVYLTKTRCCHFL